MIRPLAAIVAALFISALAAAQPVPPVAFTTLSLEEALEESIRTHRILVVYPSRDKGPWRKMNETTWKNPTLAAWVQWHGIAVRVDELEDPQGYAKLRSILARAGKAGNAMEEFPHVFYFRAGKFAAVYPDPNFKSYLYEEGMFGKPDPNVFYPKAVQLLFHADLLMDKLQSKEPAWSMMHEHKNPMPEAPPYEPLWNVTDDNAAAMADPAPGEDLFSILDLGRMRAKAGEYYDATGPYTWLYERGHELEPGFRAARRFLLAEMAEIASKREGSRKRFLDVRGRGERRQPWWNYEELMEWMALSAAIGQTDEAIEYLAAFTIDDQEATMIPPADRTAYSILGKLDLASDPRTIDKDALEVLRTRAARAGPAARPAGNITDEEWARVHRLRVRLLIDEGSRLHAAYLLKGDTDSAAKAAEIVLGTRNDAHSRVSLVMAAVVAGAPAQPSHREWLTQAAAMGGGSPALERRLDSGR
jgi:hypothetical protein